MSYQPNDPYLVPQPAGTALSLPQRGVPDITQGASVPTGAVVLDREAQQAAELAQRYELLERLGVPAAANEEFDELARDMAERAGFLYGFVNLFLEEQTFVGLHQPPADSGYVIVTRTMSHDHGWCPEVVARKKALPLHDVHASPRFSGNPVVDAVGIQSYFGAPLIHESGTVLGTVCVIDPVKRPLSEARRLRDIVISTGAQVMDCIASAPARR
ncbi:GAF domain-containing protein [Streptomyces sp. NBC_01022]|uniref:GAF domain-containing protein n=1 Tax=Streptomyces sp. NBC_01022 TaxID=2903723 RepID=UPI002DD7BD90|nr:GAF domain-containing protein [Streptomyces sp. NBC_01022]WRZ79462.1 GAF domain-containing protein [Streptomyces sp. NBC_01022]WRZ86214.1 GAF domain-containing protein [Streptomyces sp. NBC_01022]